MKKLNFFWIAFLLFSALSCEKTETFDSLWKEGNEAAFAEITANSSYTKLESASNNGFIMYKEVQDGKSGIKPKFTDQVKVLYTGWYKNDWTKSDTYTDENGNKITNKIIFDSTANRNNIPSTMFPSNMIDGFATALQHMEVGDKWEVWIPWKLGYGTSTQNSIRGYTTLVFEIEIVSIL